LANSHRRWASSIFSQALEEQPWYGLEQEYFILDKDGVSLGYREGLVQGQFYCGVGTQNAHGRELAEEHYSACLEAGLTISGINAEVAPGQWEFQIGPVEGILAADQLHMARFLLVRLAEKYGWTISFHPKPLPDPWNGSGCHHNFSTKSMRLGGKDKETGKYYHGIWHIERAIDRLAENHRTHMLDYGEGNEARMTGACETASYNIFTHGRADRGASVRIPNDTLDQRRGYFEDRRPASNCDPYLVTALILKTSLALN
jgi:glutamine synthetase